MTTGRSYSSHCRGPNLGILKDPVDVSFQCRVASEQNYGSKIQETGPVHDPATAIQSHNGNARPSQWPQKILVFMGNKHSKVVQLALSQYISSSEFLG